MLAVVADKTGYPADMLDLDLDLEADLGIDTVKQAEVFATIRERFGIERDDKLKLRDYPTLAHVIGFVRDRAPATAPGRAAQRPPTPAAGPEPVPSPSRAPSRRPALDVEAEVLAVVADKTGYPADMFDLDLDLEADLGIDTVKQAEVFATIRERFGIERDDKLKLRDYPTLAHVIGFVRDRAPATRQAAAPEPEPTAAGRARTRSSPSRRRPRPVLDVEAEVLAVVADKTGYPADMLDLDLDLEADLGIDTVKQAEVFATIRERFGIERDDKLKLRDYPTLAHVIGFVHDRAPDRHHDGRGNDSRDRAGHRRVARNRSTVADRRPTPTGSRGGCRSRPSGRRSRPVRADGRRAGGGHARRGRGRPRRRRRRPRRAARPTRGVEVLAIDDQPDADDAGRRIDGWLAAGPIHGVYWLAGPRRRGRRSRAWTSPPGGRPTGSGSSCCTPRCVGCTTRSRRRAPSS